MTRAVDQKTYWGLGEIVMWIRTGDHERVAAMSDLSEEDAMALAMFTRLSETEANGAGSVPRQGAIGPAPASRPHGDEF